MIIIKLLLILSFLVNFGLGLLVFLKNPQNKKVNLIFSILSWFSAGWTLSTLMSFLYKDTQWMLLWGKMVFINAGFMAATFFYFSLLPFKTGSSPTTNENALSSFKLRHALCSMRFAIF